MPARLPIKFPSTRVKSPAPRPGPSRKAHSPPGPSVRRSRSHDTPDRRPSDASRYPPSSRRYKRDGSPRRESPSPEPRREHARRRRRDSSSSPERERYPRRVEKDYLAEGRGRRPSSLAPEKSDRRSSRERPSSARHPSPPRVRPGAAPGAFNREGENDPRNKDRRRSFTPDKYKPSQYKDRPSSSKDAEPKKDAASPQPAASPAPAPAASGGSSGSNMLSGMPTAFATYAGIKAVTKHADTAKDWIKWLEEMNETPEEIQDMSAKASTARDTITQVQETLKARPDLLDDDKGQELKEQIEDAIGDTDKALGKMTKLLSEISKKGADHGNAINGMQEFWRSYRYKDEFKEKVEKADEDLQKELTHLSTLMVNIYSRALMKPAPPGAAPVPPPAPKPEDKEEKGKPKDIAAEAPKGEKKEEGKTAVAEPAKGTEEAKARDEPGQDDVTHPATTKAPADAPRPSIPRIVTPDETAQQKADGVTKTKDDAKSGSISPPPRSPSAVAVEEDQVGSPPMSAGNDTTKPSHLPSPPPTSHSDNTLKDEDRPTSRDKRGSIASEAEAQDILLDAAWDGDLESAARALRHVSHSVCDMRGLTALHLAAERDNLAVAILLLDRGADPQSRSDGGRIPLHLAARSASASMVEMLIERGKSDPNSQTAKGRTALHYAASKAEDGDEERREVLRVLRDWGADPTIEDKEGETARDVAQKREHWDAASTLRRAERKWEEDHKQGWLQRHGFLK